MDDEAHIRNLINLIVTSFGVKEVAEAGRKRTTDADKGSDLEYLAQPAVQENKFLEITGSDSPLGIAGRRELVA